MAEVTTERTLGAGRVLVLVYGVFVVAAAGRSASQLATHAGRAPLSYALSALAAVMYAAGLVTTTRVERGRRGRAVLVARALAVAELVCVLAVGTASLVFPDAFPDRTVWSEYGMGYLFVPLALPVLVLLWLRGSDRALAP